VTDKLFAYLQLVRLPNVFTALADVAMGFLFTQPVGGERWGVFVFLLAASGVLYSAGMMLNDVYDRAIDARERPAPPLPSGRIDAGWAKRLAFGMLGLGVLCGILASVLARDLRPLVVSAALANAVVLYDGVLKATPLGPVAMSACRGLNVLLGMSAAPQAWDAVHALIAAAIAVYIIGVTWFARTEAKTSSRVSLTLATLVILAGPALLLRVPSHVAVGELAAPLEMEPERWDLMWAALIALIAWRCVRAIARPTPANVQSAVRHCILSLIVLDAAIVVAVREVPWALAILALLIPAMFLGRWIYST
jgi:4-hydroxybenzoate polyprenyltransferase